MREPDGRTDRRTDGQTTAEMLSAALGDSQQTVLRSTRVDRISQNYSHALELLTRGSEMKTA